MIPLWAVGLVLAGLAPFAVSYLTDALEARAKKRTERAIEGAREDDRNA